MLSEQKKIELREMAGSAALRDEFRTLRRNSQQLERRMTLGELMRWLSTTAQRSSKPTQPRRFVEYKNVKF